MNREITENGESNADMDRRAFLRLGFNGGTALGGAVAIASLSGCSARPCMIPVDPPPPRPPTMGGTFSPRRTGLSWPR